MNWDRPCSHPSMRPLGVRGLQSVFAHSPRHGSPPYYNLRCPPCTPPFLILTTFSAVFLVLVFEVYPQIVGATTCLVSRVEFFPTGFSQPGFLLYRPLQMQENLFLSSSYFFFLLPSSFFLILIYIPFVSIKLTSSNPY